MIQNLKKDDIGKNHLPPAYLNITILQTDYENTVKTVRPHYFSFG